MGNHVLGIWDGHDAGAVLMAGERIIFAVNEERLSRRKLDIGFPHRSVAACLAFAGLSPEQVRHVAVSTADPAKTLTRVVPGLKEDYYLLRRRKKDMDRLGALKKRFKYRFTELGPNTVSAVLSSIHLHRRLRAMGFEDFDLSLRDHHACHAHAAARCSGFDPALVITIDGVGDGLCGSISRFENGELTRLKPLPANSSPGIFFEHVTNLMNMRELEDEGKVMALANYAYPVPDDENPMMELMYTRGLDIVTSRGTAGIFSELKRILWRYPSEQFAYMAQRVLEKTMLDLVRNAVAATGLEKVAVSGGVFSNIKLNMKIESLPEIDRLYVFPHMGDGGLAAGAAMMANREVFGVRRCRLNDLYLGPAFSREEIISTARSRGFSIRQTARAPEEAARFISEGEIILWFQGRMEYGPRALGARSILARPDDRSVKDRLNLTLKKRVWYQPFCPSMLMEDAPALLEIEGRHPQDNRFMTNAYPVRKEHLGFMEGVTNIDGTCRPQFVSDENPGYRRLLEAVRAALGFGVVLNTSFNIHGDPVVCSPEDALDTFVQTGVRHIVMEDLIIENPAATAL